MNHGTLTRKVHRRRFLRGLGGVALALPFLESLAPRSARGQAPSAPKRLGIFFCCNGVNVGRWFPTGAPGALTPAQLVGTANEPLLPYAKHLLFPRGVHMSPRGYNRDGGAADDHGKGMAQKLTAQFAEGEAWLAKGPSIDHVLAAHINPGMDGARRPPLNLMVGDYNDKHSLGYISYSAGGRAVAAVNNPWNAYSELIGANPVAGVPHEAEERILRRRQSVIDLVDEQFGDLKRQQMSGEDRRKLEAHLSAVRDIELRIGQTGLACGSPGPAEAAAAYASTGDASADQARVLSDSEYPSIADLQLDIFALSLACDYTRVATMLFGRGAGGPTFKWSGMNHEYNHHKLSHGKVRDDCFGDGTANGCADVPGYADMLFDIDRWHQERFARLLGRLSSYVEADGRSVLDNSVILYTNELSDGKTHSYTNLPYILAGSAGGYFKQGAVVALGDPANPFSELAPHNRLLNTLVNALGVESDWFGAPEGSGGRTMQRGIYEELLA